MCKACSADTGKAASIVAKDTVAYRRKSWLRQATIDLWLKAERHSEVEVEDAVAQVLKEQRADVVKQLRRLEKEKPGILADKHAAERIVEEVFDPREWDERMLEVVTPAVARTVARGYLSARAIQAGRRRRFPPVYRKMAGGNGSVSSAKGWEDMPMSEEELRELLSFELPPKVTRSIYRHTSEIMSKYSWKGISDTGKERMQWSLQAGIEEGKTLADIADDIKSDIGSDDTRSKLIATTEVTASLNSGHLSSAEEAEEAGVKIAKVWVTIGDDRVREEHEAADGQVVEGSDGLFQVGDEQAPYPGWPELSPESRCGCRCTFLAEPILDEEKSHYVMRGGKLYDTVYAAIAREEWLAEKRAGLLKGGPGSGNFDHAGRPGEVGGSSSGDSSDGASRESAAVEKQRVSAEVVEKWAGLAKSIPSKVYVKAKTYMRKKYEKLSERYGKSMAKAIMAVGIASWAVPVPGATVVAVAPLVAAAELYRRLSRDKAAEFSEMSEEDIEAIAKRWWEETLREWTERGVETKGGPGSGNFGHEGRPGEVGGSAPSEGSEDASSSGVASRLSDVGDSYTGAADDYETLIREAAGGSDGEAAEKAAYEAYHGLKEDVRGKLDEFRDAVTDAAIDAYGGDHGASISDLDAKVDGLFDEVDGAAAELVDMPFEIAKGDRDAADLDEAAGKLREVTEGIPDRLYGIAREFLDEAEGADEE